MIFGFSCVNFDSVFVFFAQTHLKLNLMSTIIFKSSLANGFEWLSNFAQMPLVVDLADDSQLYFEFNSTEELYQRLKFASIDPTYGREMLFSGLDSKAIKQRSGKGFYLTTWGNSKAVAKRQAESRFDQALRLFENRYRDDAMMFALLHKFTQSSAMAAKLAATGTRVLHERGRFKREYWSKTGQDMLGKMLMQVRDMSNVERAVRLRELKQSLKGLIQNL